MTRTLKRLAVVAGATTVLSFTITVSAPIIQGAIDSIPETTASRFDAIAGLLFTDRELPTVAPETAGLPAPMIETMPRNTDPIVPTLPSCPSEDSCTLDYDGTLDAWVIDGMQVTPDGTCPSEDSCQLDYRGGAWYVAAVHNDYAPTAEQWEKVSA